MFSREIDHQTLAFSAAPVWELYRIETGWIINIPSASAQKSSIGVRVLFDKDFREGDLYFNRFATDAPEIQGSMIAFVIKLVMIHLLNHGRGVLLHACGLSHNGQGILFVGVSGAGKTTTANLWRKQSGVTLLSDDRVVVRKREDGRFWIYGTPWYGDAKAASPEAVPLERVFILRHGNENCVLKIPSVVAVEQLFRCASPAFWNPTGVDFTLRFLESMVQELPTFRYDFLPDPSAVEYIQRL